MVQWFGTMYDQAIQECGDSPTRTTRVIAQSAGIPRSHRMDIDTERLQAEYVTVGDRRVMEWRA